LGHRMLRWEVKAGRVVRKYRVVKSDGPNDLVFQSVKDGKPIRDNNILTRFIKPAARKLGLGWVNWRRPENLACSLAEDGRRRREGCAGSDASLSSINYTGHLPAVRAESQQRVVEKLSSLSKRIN